MDLEFEYFGEGGYVLKHTCLLAEHNQECFFPTRYLGIRTIARCERRDLPLRQISWADETLYGMCCRRHSPNNNGLVGIFIESNQATALSLARTALPRGAPQLERRANKALDDSRSNNSRICGPTSPAPRPSSECSIFAVTVVTSVRQGCQEWPGYQINCRENL